MYALTDKCMSTFGHEAYDSCRQGPWGIAGKKKTTHGATIPKDTESPLIYEHCIKVRNASHHEARISQLMGPSFLTSLTTHLTKAHTAGQSRGVSAVKTAPVLLSS